MKIRSGFVSNSSSSSFLILTTIENHEKAFNSLTEEQKKVIEKIEKENKKVFGKDVIEMFVFDCADSGTLNDIYEELFPDDEDWEYYDSVSEAFHTYKEVLSKDEENCFIHEDYS